MGVDTNYRIFALCQGWRECDFSLLLYLTQTGRMARMPYFFWILVPEDTKGILGEPILVDTGFLEGECKSRYPGFEDFRRPRDLLEPFDIEPSGVRRVILSHLHWDHFSASRLYPEANFYLQKKELEFWRGNKSDHHFLRHFVANLEDVAGLEKEGRLHLLDGETEIEEGITVHLTGGHTPGLQIVRVRTAEGWAVLAVDAAYVIRSLESMIPPGIHVHVDECLSALDTVKELADRPNLVFPGHDIETLKRFPEAHPGVFRLA
jgi:glyoxylase-like metal-dependent hydrolase (beta-lactamase superfamily II)